MLVKGEALWRLVTLVVGSLLVLGFLGSAPTEFIALFCVNQSLAGHIKYVYICSIQDIPLPTTVFTSLNMLLIALQREWVQIELLVVLEVVQNMKMVIPVNLKGTAKRISPLILCVQTVQIWLLKDMMDSKRVYGYIASNILGLAGFMIVHTQIGHLLHR
uniref:RNA pseudouridine synthase 7-like isoform X4 n=1 Tax=Rhizophora mucronata TaxID=61149 RepID=A0A2P2KY50_RHIMU